MTSNVVVAPSSEVLVMLVLLKSGFPSVFRPFRGWLEVSAEVGIVITGTAENDVVVGKNEDTKV